jgi:autotransporter strand-loop-strand O-heptosyltransferase
LAWGLNKKVILISGFSMPFSEFFTPYRVINTQVCHGCWNDTNYKFNAGDWNWCPRNNDFICSKEISFNMVKHHINSCAASLRT